MEGDSREPPEPPLDPQLLNNMLNRTYDTLFQMAVYTSLKTEATMNDLKLIWKYTNLSILENDEK